MHALVLKQFKVFNGVVESVAINMMDNLRSHQRTTYVLLHYVPMLKHARPVREGYFEVPISNYRALPVEPSLRNVGIAKSLKPLIVNVAKAFGLVRSTTTIDGASKTRFTLCLSLLGFWISVFSGPLKMRGAHPPTTRGFFTSLDRAFFHGFLMPPCSGYSLCYDIAHPNKRRNGKHWVNSGNPKSYKDMAILSQAGGTPPEGAETTGGVKSP